MTRSTPLLIFPRTAAAREGTPGLAVAVKFPAMPACTNCGDCCGPVTATFKEVRRIRNFVERGKIEWVDHDDATTCGFYQNQRCAIYEARPAACRMYGVVKEMPCPYLPNSVRMSLPAKDAFARGLMSLDDNLLATYFAPDRGVRMTEATVDAMQRPPRINIIPLL